MHDIAININSFVLQTGKYILPILKKIQGYLCSFTTPLCAPVILLLGLGEVYSHCFIYILHDVMTDHFASKQMVNKITSDKYSNLSDKIVFGLWTQMVITLKDAEKQTGRNRENDTLCKTALASIGGGDINNLETNAYTFINELGNNMQLNNNLDPATTNLPGIIDTGLRVNGINDSNLAEVAAKAGLGFLNEDEIKQYETLMKKITKTHPSITCDDLQQYDDVTRIKLSMYSLINNQTNNFFYTNLKCRIFGTDKINFSSDDGMSILGMVYAFLFADWKQLIKDFLTIMLTNEGFQPFFLTKLFGNKSVGMKKNFIRDLIDDGFEKAKNEYKNRPADYNYYVTNSVADGIYNFIITILKAFVGKLINLDSEVNGKWVGIDKDIYTDFRRCKSGLCTYEQVTAKTKKVIMDVQSVQATISSGYTFGLGSFNFESFNLESEENMKKINAILNTKDYTELNIQLRTNNPEIVNNPELAEKWKKAIYNQYKEALSFYKEYTEYNTAIVKHISSNLETNQNVGFNYRLYSYNYNNQDINKDSKIKTFADNYLIRPCPEKQILIFFTENDEVKFNCLDFSDVNMEKYNEDEIINDDKFQKEFSDFAKIALDNNFQILNVFDNAKKVICNDDEYCKGIDVAGYNNFVTDKRKEFNQLLLETETNIEKVNVFQKNFLYALKNELKNLNATYGKKIPGILKDISVKEDELKDIKEQLKNDKMDENNRFILSEKQKNLEKEINFLKRQRDYINERIDSIQNSQNGLLQDINKAEKNNFTTVNQITNNFILDKLANPETDPDYFAFLYFKYFSITDENVDILTLYEFFSSNKESLTDLSSKVTNNKYYFDSNFETINDKLLKNPEVKQSILKTLKTFLYKKQKEQYLYTGKMEDGYYVKNEKGENMNLLTNEIQVGDGFEIVKDVFSKTKPYDLGIEETKADLAQITALKEDLVERKNEAEKVIAEFKKTADASTKALLEKMEAREKIKSGIIAKLTQINDEDEKYYERYKEYYKQQKAKEEAKKREVDKKEEEYFKALKQFDELAERQNNDFYNNQIKPYLDKVKDNKTKFDELDKELKDYMSALQQKAETDYNQKREDAREEIYKLSGKISTLEKEMMRENITDEEYDKFFEQWETNIKKLNKYDNFLMKSYENQKFDIEMLKNQYYNKNEPVEFTINNKPVEGFDSKASIEKKKEKHLELLSETAAFPVYVTTTWEKFKATLSTISNRFKRFFSFGGVEETEQEEYNKAKQKVYDTSGELETKEKEYSQIKDSVLKLQNALNKYIEPLLNEEKRSWWNKGVFGEFLTESVFDETWDISDNNIKFDSKMNQLRAELDGLKNDLENIDNEIAKDKKQMSGDKIKNIEQKQKLIDDINNKEIKIKEREEQLKADIEKRKEAYEELLKKQEEVDKQQLANFNHKFGYSIKIDDNGQISLQKTSNSFATSSGTVSNEKRLLEIYNKANTDEQKGIIASLVSLFGNAQKEEMIGKGLPLNDNSKLFGDKVKDGFPPIIFGKDIQKIMDLKDVDVNVFTQKYALDLITVYQNLEVLSKQKIQQYINEHYEVIGEGDSTTYVMKTQIKMWEGTFIDFSLDNFKKAFAIAMEEKQANAKKVNDYTWSQKTLNGEKETITLTSEQIDNVFGVRFDYFNNLKIRGADESHPEQQSINAIKGNVIAQGKDKGKMVDGVILPIIPLNIYQSSLNNYEMDFENDSFKMFIPGRIELTR
jgi:hypothetical protein